jgi:ankyrin repeat protein
LIFAARNGAFYSVTALVELGADYMAKNDRGQTARAVADKSVKAPLMRAIKQKTEEKKAQKKAKQKKPVVMPQGKDITD